MDSSQPSPSTSVLAQSESILSPIPPPLQFGVEVKAPRPDPLSLQFLVIQLDPVGMVRNLNLDDEAVTAAEELATKTQKYLVAVFFGLDLIFAKHQWSRYAVYPVATTSRPACPELDITSEMVVPIPPNPAAAAADTDKDDETKDFRGRFPFHNCYFWCGSLTLVRIHMRRGGDSFDIANAIKMPASLELDLLLLERSLPDSPQATATCPSLFPLSSDYFPVIPHDPALYMGFKDDESNADHSNSTPGPRSESEPGSGSGSRYDGQLPVNVLGLNDDDAVMSYIPLFNAWPEIDQHLEESTIGSPAMLWREQHLISLIIREGVARKERGRIAFVIPPEDTVH